MQIHCTITPKKEKKNEMNIIDKCRYYWVNKPTVLSIVESANSWDYVRGSGYFEKVIIANGFRIRLRNCKQNEIQPVLTS
jgi:hypothetical protein